MHRLLTVLVSPSSTNTRWSESYNVYRNQLNVCYSIHVQAQSIHVPILHVYNGSSSSCKGSGGQPEFQELIASQCQDNPYIDRTKRSLCKGHWIFMGNQFFIGRRIAVELVWCRIGSNPLMGRGWGGTEIPVICHHGCTQRYLCMGHYIDETKVLQWGTSSVSSSVSNTESQK